MPKGSTTTRGFKGRHRAEFAWFHLSDAIPGLSIDARRAARQVLEACRRGTARTHHHAAGAARVLLNAACRGHMAGIMELANRVLPAPADDGGRHARSGWQSVSAVSPSVVSRLVDRASLENNELPSGAQA